MNKQQKEFYKIFCQHGSGDAQVRISANEVAMLTVLTMSDLQLPIPNGCRAFDVACVKGFYYVDDKDVSALPDISDDDCFEMMSSCGVTDINSVSFLYLKNLCDLYRRRVKYSNILSSQCFPSANQVMPRSLLEFGHCDNQLLADWIQWRKLLFDFDNRCAQETGYLFEPILSSCLGAESVSAIHSPVKRIDESGNISNKGRQIDCYLPEEREVYELKMRVTIAASGQGRFSEEMSFPYEAMKAGLTPILVVFDDNSSVLLSKLCKRYEECGGRFYIGEAAWNMLKDKAGKEMGLFIDNYIYPPFDAMEREMKPMPNDIVLSSRENSITISNKNSEYKFFRTQIE